MERDGNPLGHEQPAARADNQDPACFGQTPWQTVGPFFHYGLPWTGGADLIGRSVLGARPDLVPERHFALCSAVPRQRTVGGDAIEIAGQIRDGNGAVVPDAMVEIWQADAAGQYARADAAADAFIGFGRAATGADGRFIFRTVKPGRVPGPGGRLQAPHLAVGIFGRGILKRLVTRVYFDSDPANGDDPILNLVPAARRATLLAREHVPNRWHVDILLSGAGETVFFAL